MAHKATDRFRLNDAAYQFTSGEYAGIKTASNSCSSFLYFFIVQSLDKHIYSYIIFPSYCSKYSRNNTAFIVVPPFCPFVCNLVKVTVFTTYVDLVLICCHAFGIFHTLHMCSSHAKFMFHVMVLYSTIIVRCLLNIFQIGGL